MPNVYKKKDCPNCGKTFRSRAVYCCQACRKEHYVITDEQREKLRELARRSWADKTSESNIKKIEMLREKNLIRNGYQVEPIMPQTHAADYNDNYFSVDDHHVVSNGDYWVEDGF